MSYKEIKEQAKKELEKEITEEAKKEYKALLRRLNSAKQVVKNLERELLDYDEELNTKFSDTKSNN